jgi:hypothetical protein
MSFRRQFVALAVASLLAPGPSRPAVTPLAIITHAQDAHIGTADASIGSTIYEGDRLSTEAEGTLRVSATAATLQLDAQSAVVIRRSSNSDAILIAELASGTLVFSARTGNIAVSADEALIRPAAPAATMAHIRVVNRKELRVYTQRGTLEFSYRGESEVLAEGQSYRILLDPSERDVASVSPPEADKRKSAHAHHTFLLIAIAAAAAIAIPLLIHHFESPDKP